LLNSENELYQAKRSLVNAQYDREIAYGRVLNSTNQLLQRLELSKAETGAVDGAEGWDAGEEGAERCPPEVVAAPVIDKARLDARARDNLQQLTRSLVLTANARNPVEKPAASESVKPKPVVNRADDVVTGRLLAWARSWSAKDVEGYFSFYSPDFRPELSSVEAWRSQRQQRIETASSIQVTISEVLAAPAGTDAMETRFRQRYESGTFADESERRILWRRIKDQWFIISESGR
jgi:adhesin transport system outer membrane protein